jgi:hypothetical protein
MPLILHARFRHSCAYWHTERGNLPQTGVTRREKEKTKNFQSMKEMKMSSTKAPLDTGLHTWT